MVERNEISAVDLLFVKYPSAFLGGGWFGQCSFLEVVCHTLLLCLLWLVPFVTLSSNHSLSNSFLLSLTVSIPVSIIFITNSVLQCLISRGSFSKLSKQQISNFIDSRLSPSQLSFSILLTISSSFFIFYLSSNHPNSSFALFFSLSTALKSLIKQPDPEPSSPIFSYSIAAYSRSYFISVVGLLFFVTPSLISPFLIFLLSTMPFLTLLGLIPSPNIFTHWLLEQLNIVILGGSGFTSLKGASFSIILSGFFVFVSRFIMVYYLDHTSRIVFSFFICLCLSLVYLSARIPPNFFSNLIFFVLNFKIKSDSSVKSRITSFKQFVSRTFIGLISFSFIWFLIPLIFHSTFLSFNSINPSLIAAFISSLFSFVLSNLRQQFPFGIFNSPFFSRSQPHFSMSVTTIKKEIDPPAVWEVVFTGLKIIESAVVFPFFVTTLFINSIAINQESITQSVSFSFVLIICYFKLIRRSIQFSCNWFLLTLYFCFSKIDFAVHFNNLSIFKDNPILFLFLFSVFSSKLFELISKLYFNLYSLPTINGFSILFAPHSAFILANKLLSVLLSAPIVPYCGAAFAWVCGTPRPVKFWHSDEDQKDPSFNWDDVRRLDGAFYDQLNQSLSRSLSRDGFYGRLGDVDTGDVLFLTGDPLTAMVVVVEKGLGYIGFQLRGLEFKGTPCHNSEMRSIESVLNSVDFLGDVPGWQAFRFHLMKLINADYRVFTYSVADNPLGPLLGSFDFCSLLIVNSTYALAFVLATDSDLRNFLTSRELSVNVSRYKEIVHSEVGGPEICPDWDRSVNGVTFNFFIKSFGQFSSHCRASHCTHLVTQDVFDSILFTLSCLMRRVLLSNSSQSSTFDLSHRFNSVFQGDLSSLKDLSWVPSSVKRLLVLAARFSLKLHCDYFIDGDDEFSDPQILLSRLHAYKDYHIICSEREPLWNQAIRSESHNIDTLRTYLDDGERKFSILQLKLQYQKFGLLKLNQHSVFGQWASAVHEVVFVGNEDAERASLQQCSSCLRNLTVSSANAPTGYPLAVCGCVCSLY
ncbi:hypothetical protein P9112_004124 [Eukaryota sp. TZLM1-RC]